MGKSSRSYLWYKSNLWAYNLQSLGKNQGFRKRHLWTQTKKEGDRWGGKGDIICQWNYKCLSRKNSPEYLSPQNNKRAEWNFTISRCSWIPFPGSHSPIASWAWWGQPPQSFGIPMLREADWLKTFIQQIKQRIYSTKIHWVPTVCQALFWGHLNGQKQTQKVSSLLELTFQWGKPTS